MNPTPGLGVRLVGEAFKEKHRLRAVHKAMRFRCAKETDPGYPRYGGRGITVCAGWQDVRAFKDDMGPRPKGHSIDRINNDLGYWCGKCPECVSLGRASNCRWATQKEQMRNTRQNVWLTHEGETMVVEDWAARTGLSNHLLAQRVKRGWTAERALTTPVIPKSAKRGPRNASAGVAS